MPRRWSFSPATSRNSAGPAKTSKPGLMPWNWTTLSASAARREGGSVSAMPGRAAQCDILMNRLTERSLLLLLAAVQFTHIVDFMILMPLGPQLMRELQIGPGHFSALVAAYTISSGAVGFLAAPFIDRFDRRILLLFAYAGFITGTLACALSQDATALLAARG